MANTNSQVRRSVRERREARLLSSDYVPLRPAPLTELGDLPSA